MVGVSDQQNRRSRGFARREIEMRGAFLNHGMNLEWYLGNYLGYAKAIPGSAKIVLFGYRLATNLAIYPNKYRSAGEVCLAGIPCCSGPILPIVNVTTLAVFPIVNATIALGTVQMQRSETPRATERYESAPMIPPSVATRWAVAEYCSKRLQ